MLFWYLAVIGMHTSKPRRRSIPTGNTMVRRYGVFAENPTSTGFFIHGDTLQPRWRTFLLHLPRPSCHQPTAYLKQRRYGVDILYDDINITAPYDTYQPNGAIHRDVERNIMVLQKARNSNVGAL